MVYFVLPMLLVLTLAFNKSVLYGNAVLSIVMLSTKKDSKGFLLFRKVVSKSKH